MNCFAVLNMRHVYTFRYSWRCHVHPFQNLDVLTENLGDGQARGSETGYDASASTEWRILWISTMATVVSIVRSGTILNGESGSRFRSRHQGEIEGLTKNG